MYGLEKLKKEVKAKWLMPYIWGMITLEVLWLIVLIPGR